MWQCSCLHVWVVLSTNSKLNPQLNAIEGNLIQNTNTVTDATDAVVRKQKTKFTKLKIQ